ncbi:hypothetical protein [Vibrio sp. 10N.239.312.D08]|uniref:hypothetical protein n=1 Tax=Vibrio sp. 10N.239.312.D08 TaxID=3229978 RepID=UPI00354BFBF2
MSKKSDHSLLTEKLEVSIVAGSYFLWDRVPVDEIKETLKEIEKLPTQLLKQWQIELHLFTESCKKGEINFLVFTDSFIPVYISSYAADGFSSDSYDAKLAIKMYGNHESKIDEQDIQEELNQITALFNEIDRQKETFSSLVKVGGWNENEQGLLALSYVYSDEHTAKLDS